MRRRNLWRVHVGCPVRKRIVGELPERKVHVHKRDGLSDRIELRLRYLRQVRVGRSLWGLASMQGRGLQSVFDVRGLQPPQL